MSRSQEENEAHRKAVEELIKARLGMVTGMVDGVSNKAETPHEGTDKATTPIKAVLLTEDGRSYKNASDQLKEVVSSTSSRLESDSKDLKEKMDFWGQRTTSNILIDGVQNKMEAAKRGATQTRSRWKN